MLAVLAAVLSFRAATVDIKPIWKIGPTISLSGNTLPIGNLTRLGSSHEFISLSGPIEGSTASRAEILLYKLDANTGAITELQSLIETHEGEPGKPVVSTYSIGPTGELINEYSKELVRTFSVVDPTTGQLRFTLKDGLNGCFEPTDEAALIASTLFPGRFLFKSAGEVPVLSDGPNARIAMSGYEVNSYYPGTWDIKSRLVKKGDLMSKARPFLDPQMKGDPQSGTFTISNSLAHAFFHGDERLTNISEEMEPMDAGPNGFLDMERPPGAPRQYVCLSAETGERLWTFSERAIGIRHMRWVGNYAVTITAKAIDRSGKVVCRLIVLDARTGKTVGETLLAPGVEIWGKSGLEDVLILADDRQNKYYGYRIVPK